LSRSLPGKIKEHSQGEHYRLAEGFAGHQRRHRGGVACRGDAAAGAGRPDRADGGLSKALASRRLLVHDRDRVLADLACAIADGAAVISDFRVMADQGGLFGPVASVPTCWRALNEIAAGGSRALARVTAAVNVG
jgi:hypothetical protein